MQKVYDVVGVGHALVDIVAETSEDGLKEFGFPKGGMTLIDSSKANELYRKLSNSREISGGSAANTIAGLALLGHKTAFIGKIASDSLGTAFAKDMYALGIAFHPVENDALLESTGCCHVLVTPDAQRTMATSLGISYYVEPADIHKNMVEKTKILYLEGYLWDQDHAKKVLLKAIEMTKKSGGKIAFTLSDTFCIERHRDDFFSLIRQHLDIVFSNEAELLALYQTTNFDEALEKLTAEKEGLLAVVTRSEKGCVVVSEGKVTAHPTQRVEKVIDTTGAGDLFAAGFLSGYSKGLSLEESATLANKCAAHIIQHYGARPKEDFIPSLQK